MNSSQIPCFFLCYPNPNYTIFHPYTYPVIFPENKQILSESLQNRLCSEQRDNFSKQTKDTMILGEKRTMQREAERNKTKKLQPIKKQEKDAQFKQRQQTANRNLCSNTLKIFFKQLRDKNSQTFLNIRKIIEVNKLAIKPQEFLSKIDSMFPASSTYISFESLKKVCSPSEDVQENIKIGKILRTSVVRFFSYEIYTVNIKSIRTTRKIRNQQIKQGKIFLRELCH